MLSFIKKTAVAIFTLFLIASFTFLLLFLVPGDPVDFILKDGASLEDKNLLRKELGLDKSFMAQYVQFLKNISSLNLGQSVHTGDQVLHSIARQFPFTFFLTVMSLGLALLWGISFGVLSAYPRFKKWDKFFNFFPLIFFSVPVFVSAPLLIWLFSNQLKWLPVSGVGSFSYLLLPSISLALPLGAILMKMTRASILEVLSSDYVRTANSKGLSISQVYFKHVLKNAFIPILTVLGLQMGSLLTGTVIVETIFDRPGIGSLLYQSIVSRDYPLVQALVLLIAFIYIFINWLTDWFYKLFNPFMESS